MGTLRRRTTVADRQTRNKSIKRDEEHYWETIDGVDVAVVFHRSLSAPKGAVVMAHGFHGSKIGSARRFVLLARELARDGVASLRFDQIGSGDSEGRFEDASFDQWVTSVAFMAHRLQADGLPVALLGESMGGNATLGAAMSLGSSLRGVAMWSPDPLIGVEQSVDTGDPSEEAGQKVSARFWTEARVFGFEQPYKRLAVPSQITFGTLDHFVPLSSMKAIDRVRSPLGDVRIIEGLPHSSWPVDLGDSIVAETRGFLLRCLEAKE